MVLVVSDQQLINRLSLFCYGADGAENADSLDMETGIEVVEKTVLRILLTGIGVGKHSFGTGFAYLFTEPGKVNLLRITEV